MNRNLNTLPKKQICISGGCGFIGSHLARRLRSEGHYIVIIDWQQPQFFKQKEICDKFYHLDCRSLENCQKATKNADWVFHLACDMGGMGFIQNSPASCLFNNLMSSLSMIEASRLNKVSRFFYASSACVYPQALQVTSETNSLKESSAWPADPQDGYGLEKIVTERLAHYYSTDFSMKVRIARFHNIYGPYGTWKGGREKAPAAFIRKAICSTSTTGMQVWGDGKSSRSFCYIDDCIEGILRIMMSDYSSPLNLGSCELVTMNEMAEIALSIAKNSDTKIVHVAGPQGVRGRNSDNTLIHSVLGWSPSIPLKEGLTRLHAWMKPLLFAEQKSGFDITKYTESTILDTTTPAPIGQTFQSIDDATN